MCAGTGVGHHPWLPLVLLWDLSFINLHLPSGGCVGAAKRYRAAMLCGLHPSLQWPVPLILVCDFNCVILRWTQRTFPLLLTGNFPKNSLILSNFLVMFSLLCSFSHHVQFSWFGCGKSSSRLDHVYLPPLLGSRPPVAFYMPSVYDHNAFLLCLETAGVAMLPTPPTLV
jgi:hypothetical protein